MESLTCRLLIDAAAVGSANMAADEVLLESAEAGGASLRFYTWSEPTLSLGYFQSAATRLADPLVAGLPFVRRMTGGDAIVHHHELTYALALPSARSWHGGESWMFRLHLMIVRAFANLGVALDLMSADPGGKPLLCFQHPTPGDVLWQGRKVVGSAQRKRRGALLQHGSILLATSPHAPQLPGLQDLTKKTLAADDVRAALIAEFAQQTGWHVQTIGWTPAEKERCEALARTRYAAEGWNGKR